MLQLLSLTLQDFQGHRRMEVPLGRLTAIRGANGSGKSSIRRAVEWLLTGQVAELGLTAKAAPEVLIRGWGTPGGAKAARVAAHLADGTTLTREAANRLKVEGPAKDGLRLPAKELVSLACSPVQLIDWKPDDLRDLLFTALTDGIAREEVLVAAEEWLFEQPGINRATVDAVLQWCERALPPWPSVQDRDALYKQAYGDRREANGAVRTLKQQVESLTAAISATAPADAKRLETARQRLADYRTQAQHLQARILEAREQQRQQEAGKLALDEAERHLAELRIKTGIATGDGHPGDEAALRAQIATLTQQIGTIRGNTGACPVYAGVQCPLTADAVGAHLHGLIQDRQRLIQELAQVVICQAVSKVQAARTEMAAVAAGGHLADGEQELAQLNRLIDEETEQLQRLAAASGLQTGARESAARAREQLVTATAEALKLNLAVKCFDTDGMRARLVGRRLQALQQRINEGLARLLGAGWAVRLESEGEHPIRVSHPGHGAAVLKSLSTAERTLVAVAVVDALNDFHELGILCLDDVEHLTGRNREALMGALEGFAASGRYGNIVVLEADGSESLTVRSEG